MKHLLPLLLFSSIFTLAQPAELSNDSDGPSPEGCYRLALMVPREISRYEASNMSFHVCGNLEICLKSENVREHGDRFGITIRDGNKTIATYQMTHAQSDASGSSIYWVFAASEEVLRDIKTFDYARLGRAPYENIIFYILTWPELKGGKPVKPGEYAGKVAIGRMEYALIKK
jgi:hypothetical protein